MTDARTRVSWWACYGVRLHPWDSYRRRRWPLAEDPPKGNKHMAEIAHTEVRLSGTAHETPGARKPFVAPTVEHMGGLEVRTLLTDITIPP